MVILRRFMAFQNYSTKWTSVGLSRSMWLFNHNIYSKRLNLFVLVLDIFYVTWRGRYQLHTFVMIFIQTGNRHVLTDCYFDCITHACIVCNDYSHSIPRIHAVMNNCDVSSLSKINRDYLKVVSACINARCDNDVRYNLDFVSILVLTAHLTI